MLISDYKLYYQNLKQTEDLEIERAFLQEQNQLNFIKIDTLNIDAEALKTENKSLKMQIESLSSEVESMKADKYEQPQDNIEDVKQGFNIHLRFFTPYNHQVGKIAS